jgi:hypothetical protein
LVGLWKLDPDDLAATIATIAPPHTVVATSLRDAVTSLVSNLARERVSARVCSPLDRAVVRSQ